MAVRRFLLSVGQSNASPFADGAGWRARHAHIDVTLTSLVAAVTQGTTREQLLLPDSWPSPFNVAVDLRGVTINRLRFLQFWHPSVTGYATYPHIGRVASDAGGSANTTSAFYVEQVFHSSAASGASQVTIVRRSTGESRAITAVGAGIGTQAGCRITLASAWSSAPVVGEQFDYEIRAVGASVGSTVVLTMSFGLKSTHANALQGLKLSIGGVARDIVSWNNATRTATLSSAPSSADGALLTLGPRRGTFDSWAYWLPFSPFEGATGVRTNPYPYGFNYPGFMHAMDAFYNPTTGAAVLSDFGHYVIGVAVRLAARFGEDIYVLSSDIAGSSLARRETKSSSSTSGFGWHDAAQQRDWSPGSTTNCWGRLMTELDAAVSAAAAQGDTLECVGIVHVHGEDDSSVESWAHDWETNQRRFRDQLRAEIVARGMWSKAAAALPYVFSKPNRNTTAGWAFIEDIHDGANRLAATDVAMRTIVMDDATTLDGVHYDSAGAVLLETRALDALVDVLSADDSALQVAVCNLALSFLGDSSGVTSIDPVDGSAQSAHCARFYPIAIEEVLKMRKWTFASRRLDLTELAVDSPWAQWPFAYVLPWDFLRAISLLPPGVLDDNIVRQDNVFFDLGNTAAPFSGSPAPVPHSIEVDANGRRVLYTVQQSAVLRYVARVPLTICPPDFRTLVAWKLAEMLSGALIKGAEGAAQAKQCREMLLISLPPIDDADSDSRRVDPPHVPHTLMGRG